MATIYSAECQGCDFRQDHIIMSPVYAYRLEEMPDVHMWVQLAWCGSCRQIVRAENLLSLAEAQERAQERTERRLRQDADRYVALRASRQSPAHCLRCGSIDLVLASSYSTERVLQHPACGGTITFRHAGHARLSNETLVYSPEGEYLLTLEGILCPGRGYGSGRNASTYVPEASAEQGAA